MARVDRSAETGKFSEGDESAGPSTAGASLHRLDGNADIRRSTDASGSASTAGAKHAPVAFAALDAAWRAAVFLSTILPRSTVPTCSPLWPAYRLVLFCHLTRRLARLPPD